MMLSYEKPTLQPTVESFNSHVLNGVMTVVWQSAGINFTEISYKKKKYMKT